MDRERYIPSIEELRRECRQRWVEVRDDWKDMLDEANGFREHGDDEFAEQALETAKELRHKMRWVAAARMRRPARETRAESSGSMQRMVGERLYVASKTTHAAKWRELRARGVPVVASWIDEAGEGQTADYSELAVRCIHEATTATAVLLYCEPGELLKGALVEVGAALAAGVRVRCVGECESISRVFRKHPLWSEHASVEAAALSNDKLSDLPG